MASEAHKAKMERKKADRAKRHRYQDDPVRFNEYNRRVDAMHLAHKFINRKNGVGSGKRRKAVQAAIAAKETEQ